MKKILIISQYIAPVQAIASIRWTKISKYLKKNHDVEIIILTNEKNYGKYPFKIEKKDPLLIDEIKYFDKYIETKFSPIYLFVKNIVARQDINADLTVQNINPNDSGLLNVLKRNIDEFVHNVFNALQASQCVKAFKKEKVDCDVIISTYGPLWTHLVAEKLKKMHPEAIWIADFRDPYAHETDTKRIFEKHKAFSKKHLCNADIITKVLGEMKVYEEKGMRVEVISNGYDPEERRMPVKPSKFIFVYTGILYAGKRNIIPLFNALKELIEEKVLLADDIEIQYAGGCFKSILEEAKTVKMERFLVDFGYISRDEVLKMQSSAAILFQADWNSEEEPSMWTGKTYEYMMAQKPTIFLMSGPAPYSAAWKNIGKLGGVCYENSRHEETYIELKNYIADKYKEWKNTGNVTIDADKDYIAQFSYANIAEKVWGLIN